MYGLRLVVGWDVTVCPLMVGGWYCGRVMLCGWLWLCTRACVFMECWLAVGLRLADGLRIDGWCVIDVAVGYLVGWWLGVGWLLAACGLCGGWRVVCWWLDGCVVDVLSLVLLCG